MPRIHRLQNDEEEDEYFPPWEQTGSEHSRSTEEENNESIESNTSPNQGTQVRVDENGRIILEIKGGRYISNIFPILLVFIVSSLPHFFGSLNEVYWIVLTDFVVVLICISSSGFHINTSKNRHF